MHECMMMVVVMVADIDTNGTEGGEREREKEREREWIVFSCPEEIFFFQFSHPLSLIFTTVTKRE